VDIYDSEGAPVGCGITNYSSRDVEIIKGVSSKDIASLLGVDYGSEVVHRNNLTVF
jgi:glutamate 5-kinase